MGEPKGKFMRESVTINKKTKIKISEFKSIEMEVKKIQQSASNVVLIVLN